VAENSEPIRIRASGRNAWEVEDADGDLRFFSSHAQALAAAMRLALMDGRPVVIEDE
jgi:hypothetical protein